MGWRLLRFRCGAFHQHDRQLFLHLSRLQVERRVLGVIPTSINSSALMQRRWQRTLLSVQPPKPSSDQTGNRREFWDAHPGLVWSNRDAPDDVFIACALHKGRYLQLLDIAVEFGAQRLARIWQEELACCDEIPESVIQRTSEIVEILNETDQRDIAASHLGIVAAP